MRIIARLEPFGTDGSSFFVWAYPSRDKDDSGILCCNVVQKPKHEIREALRHAAFVARQVRRQYL